MKKLLAALVVGAFAFGSVSAVAQEKTAPEPVDQAKLKAERDAAKAQYDKMTPDEKAAARKAANAKKQADSDALDRMATGQ